MEADSRESIAKIAAYRRKAFSSGQRQIFASEHAPGGDLGDKINMWQKEQRMFSESLVLDWFIQLMLGIQYMHEQRVLHRDLKTRTHSPQTIMIQDWRCWQSLGIMTGTSTGGKHLVFDTSHS
ncbi:PREDICTED: serine/threonine-protein kinase Nek3-like [Priapulus caudatus]|uniref:non-specific serine/threonine protein kinase n=1 Tax=Priapulus caudatus TaxID=37621 RepID=A0ABM1EJX4_PRICU|nr:PREDICTED: serine/threonine-protein kinase Nek3-like [Priapulus caudatus]